MKSFDKDRKIPWVVAWSVMGIGLVLAGVNLFLMVTEFSYLQGIRQSWNLMDTNYALFGTSGNIKSTEVSVLWEFVDSGNAPDPLFLQHLQDNFVNVYIDYYRVDAEFAVVGESSAGEYFVDVYDEQGFHFFDFAASAPNIFKSSDKVWNPGCSLPEDNPEGFDGRHVCDEEFLKRHPLVREVNAN